MLNMKVIVIKDKSVAQMIAEEIASMIGKRILHPGQHLVESDLTKRFGVSRSSVREALTILEKDHLVERIPYHGARVSNFTSEDIRHLYDAIYGLELLAMERAMDNVNKKHINDLNHILEKQKTAIEEGAIEKYYNLNEEFHKYIFQITNNPFLVELYQYLHRMVRPFRLLTLTQGNNMQFSYEEHNRQKVALEKGDLKLGAKATNEQKNRALKSLKIIFLEED